MTGREELLEALEATDALPVGNRCIESLQLDACVVQVVVDNVVAESLASKCRLREQLCCFAQCRGNAGLVAPVSVALGDGLKL